MDSRHCIPSDIPVLLKALFRYYSQLLLMLKDCGIEGMVRLSPGKSCTKDAWQFLCRKQRLGDMLSNDQEFFNTICYPPSSHKMCSTAIKFWE